MGGLRLRFLRPTTTTVVAFLFFLPRDQVIHMLAQLLPCCMLYFFSSSFCSARSITVISCAHVSRSLARMLLLPPFACALCFSFRRLPRSQHLHLRSVQPPNSSRVPRSSPPQTHNCC